MANFNFNKVIIGGRLTADPELKTTPSGVSVTTFTVAVNRRGAKNDEQKSDFFNVTAWRNTAEFITRYFRKSSSICVVGVLQTRSWADQAGQKHYATEIVADEVSFVDSKDEAPSVVNQPAAATQTPMMTNGAAAQFEEISDRDLLCKLVELPSAISDDEDLPF